MVCQWRKFMCQRPVWRSGDCSNFHEARGFGFGLISHPHRNMRQAAGRSSKRERLTPCRETCARGRGGGGHRTHLSTHHFTAIATLRHTHGQVRRCACIRCAAFKCIAGILHPTEMGFMNWSRVEVSRFGRVTTGTRNGNIRCAWAHRDRCLWGSKRCCIIRQSFVQVCPSWIHWAV